jgi:phage replication-related protein YjqB (UPF0714/DUF867 family)
VGPCCVERGVEVTPTCRCGWIPSTVVTPLLSALLEYPGVEERSVLRSRFGFLALHGGLEQGTAEIAAQAADASGASLYAVVQPEDLRWHVPSLQFDPEHSDALATFLEHVAVVVSVHGYGGLRGSDDRWVTALVGGGNRTLAADLALMLREALPHYRFVDDIACMPPELRGVHPANPVNRPRAGGVQVELPPRVRREPDLAVLIATLAAFARSSVEQWQEM